MIVPRDLAAPESNALQARAAALLASFSCSQINNDPDAVCVRARGELDIATAPQLVLTLSEAVSRVGLVVLDLGDVTFIDSAGVHAIVTASIHARQSGSRLVVLPGPASVERIFALAMARADLAFGIAEAPLPTGADATRHNGAQADQRFRSIAERRLSAAATKPALAQGARAALAAAASSGTTQQAQARAPIDADDVELPVPLAFAAARCERQSVPRP